MVINFDDRRPKTLSEQMEAIDVDAAARGFAYEMTGATGDGKVDYRFSLEGDLAELEKQQELRNEFRRRMKEDSKMRAALDEIHAMMDAIEIDEEAFPSGGIWDLQRKNQILRQLERLWRNIQSF